MYHDKYTCVIDIYKYIDDTLFANRPIRHHTLQYPVINTGEVIDVKGTCRPRCVNVSALACL